MFLRIFLEKYGGFATFPLFEGMVSEDSWVTNTIDRVTGK